jgi:hypothetical protein
MRTKYEHLHPRVYPFATRRRVGVTHPQPTAPHLAANTATLTKPETFSAPNFRDLDFQNPPPNPSKFVASGLPIFDA